METVILVIHLMLVAAMIGIILMQRSEGGALGIGGGGNFMAARGTGNVLTRATTILAAGFFVTSIVLTFIARNAGDTGLFDNLPADELTVEDAGDRPEGGVLNLLGGAPAAEEPPVVPDEAGNADTPGGVIAVPDDAGAAVPDGGGVAVPDDAGAAAPGDAGGAAAPIAVPE